MKKNIELTRAHYVKFMKDTMERKYDKRKWWGVSENKMEALFDKAIQNGELKEGRGDMAGIVVISKTEVGTKMIRLICNGDIVDRIEVDEIQIFDSEEKAFEYILEKVGIKCQTS